MKATALSEADKRVIAYLVKWPGQRTSAIGGDCFSRGRRLNSSNPFTLAASVHLNRMKRRGLVYNRWGHNCTIWFVSDPEQYNNTGT